MSGCPFSGLSSSPSPHKSLSDSDIDFEPVPEGYCLPLISPYDSLVKLYVRSQFTSKTETTHGRVMFENLPLHLQNTLFHPRHIKEMRKREVMEKFIIFADLKSAGNLEYRKGDFRKSLSIHEQTLGLFLYLDLLRETPDSEDSGVIDSDYELRSSVGKDQQEGKILRDMVVTCYLNMAACALKLSAYSYAFSLCSEAIQILPEYALAYARRAQARISDLECAVREIETAMEDAERAYRLDPKKEYRDLGARGKERIAAEQTKERDFFAGFFASVKKFGWIESNLRTEELELEHLLIRKMAEKYAEMLKFYEESEKREKLALIRQEMQVVLGVCQKMNWIQRISPTSPSAIMAEEAQRAGLDLTDSKTQDIVECVKRMSISSSFSGPKYNDQLVKYCIDLCTSEGLRRQQQGPAETSWSWWLWALFVLLGSWLICYFLFK